MTRRGSILLEVLLSVALFVAAASLVSASIRQALGTTERARLESEGTDLARSVLSLMETGALELNAAAGPVPAWNGEEYWSISGGSGAPATFDAEPSGWMIEIETGAADGGAGFGAGGGPGGGSGSSSSDASGSGQTVRAGDLTLVTVTAVYDPEGDGQNVTSVSLSMLLELGMGVDEGSAGEESDLSEAAREGARLERRP